VLSIISDIGQSSVSAELFTDLVIEEIRQRLLGSVRRLATGGPSASPTHVSFITSHTIPVHHAYLALTRFLLEQKTNFGKTDAPVLPLELAVLSYFHHLEQFGK
jgi:hypothetical protein